MSQLAVTSRPPNEKPTVYRGPAAFIGGSLVVLFCTFGSIDLIVEAGTRDLTGSAILMLVAVLAALYGVYPAAFSWSDRLVVRNPFRTIDLPWDAVTDLSARLSFIAHTETKRFTVWAIPVSLRERRRAERHKVRDMTQAQRAAKRGLSADLFGSSASNRRRPADPITSLSFADQAIAEMNAKRENYAVKVRLAATAAEAAKAKAAAEAATAESATAEDAAASVADDVPVVRAEGAEAATVSVNAGAVRWTWASFGLLAASVAFLVVALTIHH